MEQTIRLAKELIAFKTVTGAHAQTARLYKHIEGFLKGAGLKIRHYESEGFTSLAISSSPTKHTRFGLLGHVDVVPGPAPLFKPRIEGGKLYGRGAIDMKTQVAAMVVFMKHFGKKAPVTLFLTPDEETGGLNGARHLASLGFVCDFFIAPDGGANFQLVTREKGVLALKVRQRGKAGHGSRPWEGQNAIEGLISKLQRIKGLFSEDNKDKWVTTMSLNMIAGGKAMNQIPDEAEALLDIRYTDSAEAWVERIRGIAEVEIVKCGSIFSTDAGHPEVKRLAQIISGVTGKHAEATFEHGASDARHFAEKGMQGAIFNPAGDGAHSINEWVELESIGKFYTILQRFLSENI
jgi:succinyl-diaminopimelate desuccinylase